MTRPRLSIVMCTFNGGSYLQQQLDSLLLQSLLPDEIVIGDDGSTDATLGLLQTFRERAEQAGIDVRLNQNPRNLGYVENFTVGLRQSSGELVFLCDQDDVWHPDKLARMAAAFGHDPSLLLLHSDARLVDAQSASLHCSMFEALQLTAQEKQKIHAGAAFEVVLRRSFVTGATTALRRELIDLALPVASGWIHDEWLAAVASAVGRLDFIDEALIDYRQHGANQIGARKRTLAMKLRELLLPRGQLLPEEARRLRRLEQFLQQAAFAGAHGRASQIEHKRTHFERRVAIGQLAHWRRVPAIWHEARQGSYRRYGAGVRSMLRDLLRHD
ncbi:MAG: glycosyltransferase family 2 protein [Rhodanobacter sp.]